jgi:pyruvate-formate lyase
MKPNMTRANFLIPTDEWQVYKLIIGRYKSYDEKKDVLRQATASDDLREYILDYIDKHEEHVKALIAEIEKTAPTATILSALKEFVRDEKENE